MVPAAHSAIPVSISQLPPGAPWWLYAIVIAGLALHIGGGSVAILSGYTAVIARKGGPVHVFAGKIFLGAMLVMAAFGTILSIPIHQPGNIGGGILAAYLVLTGWMTVKQKPDTVGPFEKYVILLPAGLSALFLSWGADASAHGGALHGNSSSLYYVFGFIAALFAFIDVRMILRGGVSGVQRIARHLWRMCTGLFFATGSFFLGQQKVMPTFMHGSPVLWLLALAPLGFMIFWLIRIRRKARPRLQQAQA